LVVAHVRVSGAPFVMVALLAAKVTVGAGVAATLTVTVAVAVAVWPFVPVAVMV
jgi:hypothetical protein